MRAISCNPLGRSQTVRPDRPIIAIIAARARNGVIGSENALPWRIAEDLRLFRQLTIGRTIVMGRKTYESLGAALPRRQNIVVTRNPQFAAANCIVAHSIDEALRHVPPGEQVFCIGGADLFQQILPYADRIYLTQINRSFDGDTFFPHLDRTQWMPTISTERRPQPSPRRKLPAATGAEFLARQLSLPTLESESHRLTWTFRIYERTSPVRRLDLQVPVAHAPDARVQSARRRARGASPSS